MYGVQSSLYTAAIALCVFSAGLWRDRKRALGTPSLYFTLFLGIEALSFAFELLMAHPDTPLKGLWLGLRMGGSLLIAPCLWLAVREIVEGVRPRWREIGRNHLIAIAVGAVCSVPLIQNAHLGHDFINPNRITSAMHSRFIHGTMLACIGIFAVQVPVLLWRCRALLLARCDDQRGSTTWLQLPLLIVATTWGLGILRTLQCATHAPKELTLIFALTEVGVTVGAIYVLMRRATEQMFNPPEPELEPISIVEVEEPIVVPNPVVATAIVEAKYARSRLTAVIRERIERKLEKAMKVERVYRDSRLSLRSLSEAMKENVHYVSQVISQDFDSSFYDLVNHHRIEEAKHLLLAAREKTVLEIALEVGFNSKSTFNTAFRRNAGMTPTTFRDAAK
ncbi:MAG: helix-turn-helix domain-containing protein [Opitutus sp.]